jgi:peptidoglycan/xylan/chitin deacetylase (PgdA/CDA1 family)
MIERLYTFFICFCLMISSTTAQISTRKICITMDDLPAATTEPSQSRWQFITTGVLRAFQDYQVPAIGFVNEGKLSINGEASDERKLLLKQWFDAGFELGNHTWSHIDYNTHTPEQFEDDLVNGEKFIDKLYAGTPNRIRYFRHPFLHCGDTQAKKDALEKILEKHGYTTAPVSVDNSDWIFARAYDIALEKKDSAMQHKLREDYVPYMMSKVNYYETQSHDLLGRNMTHILLMHANTINAVCLPNLLAALRQDGFEFVSLAAALKDPAYKTTDNFVGRAGISWIHRWAITQQKPKTFFGKEPATPLYVQQYSGLQE